MSDLPVALLITLAETFLLIALTGALAREHLGVVLPMPWLFGTTPPNVSRRALIVELPLAGLLLGLGELVVVLMLFHPASSVGVRMVAASQLLIALAWAWYLGKRIAARGNGPR